MGDEMESKQQSENDGQIDVVPLTQGAYTGSTEVIESSHSDDRCDTPALSDIDMDEQDDDDDNKMSKTLTIVPNMIQRSNSMQNIVRRSSSSPGVCSEKGNKKVKTLKRAFSNMEGSKYSASKRRKSNMGDPIKIV